MFLASSTSREGEAFINHLRDRPGYHSLLKFKFSSTYPIGEISLQTFGWFGGGQNVSCFVILREFRSLYLVRGGGMVLFIDDGSLFVDVEVWLKGGGWCIRFLAIFPFVVFI